MEQVSFRIQEEKAREVEGLVEAGEFPNVSEAYRSLIRDGLNSRIPEYQREQVEELVEDGQFPTVPEAYRMLIRKALNDEAEAEHA